MTRDEIQLKALEIKDRHKNWLLTFATRVGKSKTGINLAEGTLLVIVPTELIKKKTWEPLLKEYHFKSKVICYASLKSHKHIWDTVICDECHSVSDANFEILKKWSPKRWIGLTATMPEEKLLLWKGIVKDYQHWDIPLITAIEWGILPEPKIFIKYVTPNANIRNCWYEKGDDKTKKTVHVEWEQRFSRQQGVNVKIRCSEKEYLDLIEQDIEFWKNVMNVSQNRYYEMSHDEIQKYKNVMSSVDPYTKGVIAANKMKILGGKRKAFFSKIKTPHFLKMQEGWAGAKYIVFTGSTEQANELGLLDTVHSNNKDSIRNYQKFIEGEIDVLYSIHMLDEGLELGNMDFSVIIQGTLGGKVKGETEAIQRIGRTLTSISPIVYVLCVKGTKDENFVSNLTKNLKPEWIHILN